MAINSIDAYINKKKKEGDKLIDAYIALCQSMQNIVESLFCYKSKCRVFIAMFGSSCLICNSDQPS